MKLTLNQCLADLHSAIDEDRAAKAEALSNGQNATQPLTLARLGELCALGERMLITGRRRKAALAQVEATLLSLRCWASS
jgi:hypothetical protein